MAIAFYQRIGATINNERRVCRITSDKLQQLAQRFSAPQDTAPATTLTPVSDKTV